MSIIKRVSDGDYFVIPLSDGRSAVCQLVWMGRKGESEKFKKIMAFAVLCVGGGSEVPNNNEYLIFENYRGKYQVIFTAVDKLLSGEWPVIASGQLQNEKLLGFEFNMGGTLYRRGEMVRVLSIDEYSAYLNMGVSGFELVDNILIGADK